MRKFLLNKGPVTTHTNGFFAIHTRFVYVMACLLLLSGPIANAQVWSAQADYFGWFGDTPANTPNATTITAGINAGASAMSGGAGITMTNISETSGSNTASFFRVQNVSSNSFASSVANNDYIKSTITVGSGPNKIRMTQARVNGWGGASGGTYFLSMVIVDLATNTSTTVFQDLSVPTATSGATQTFATPYEMLPGKSYEVRWHLYTGSTASTTRAIDNPVLAFQSLSCNAGPGAPTLNSTTLANTCPASTASLNSLVTSSTPANTSLVWFTNNAHTGTAYATPATAAAGTYYAFYYDATNNCYSPATAAVTLTITPCQGYIYVHKKALNEESSVNFPFNVTGSVGSPFSFTLNDQPTNAGVKDIGTDNTGRLFVVGEPYSTTVNSTSTTVDGAIYYRTIGSSQWVQVAGEVASRIDGDVSGGSVIITGAGLVKTISGVNGTVTTIGSASASFGGSLPVDVGSGQGTGIYVVVANGSIYKYNNSPNNWSVLAGGGISKVDVSPVDGKVVVTTSNGTVFSGGVSGSTLSYTQISSGGGYADVTVDSKGTIWALSGSTVYQYNGTAFIADTGGFPGGLGITAGLGGQVWVAGGGGNTRPFGTIFTRSNGGAVYYDDERVRTSVVDNSELIAVAPGSYTVTEAVPNGWALQDIDLYDPTNNSTSSISGTNVVINVSTGEVVHVTFQDGLVLPVSFSSTCGSVFLETFGTVPAGTYGPPLTGQTSLHYIGNNTSAGNGFYKVIGTTRNGRFATNYTPNDLDEHTTGNAGDTGQMMVIDASYPPDEFYRRRLTGLVVGQNYNFSAYIANITGGISPNVQFIIADPTTTVPVATTSSGPITSTTWQKYGLVFQATTTSIDLILKNNAPGGGGNDLALDDISFSLDTPTSPTVSVTQQPTCAAPTGTITVTAPLGAQYAYSIDGVNYQTSPVFSGTSVTPGRAYAVTSQFTNLTLTNCASTPTSVTVNGTACPTPDNGAVTVTTGGAAIANVTANDLVNGVTPTLSGTAANATLTTLNTSAGITLNTTTGSVSVAQGTAPGSYTLTYQLCTVSGPVVCATTTATVTVLADTDGDGVADTVDLDSDNDGILDTVEGRCFVNYNESFDTPLRANINNDNIIGNTYNNLFTQNGSNFNIIRVDGTGYSKGPNNAQNGTQYADIAGADYPLYSFTLTQPGLVNISAYFSNREPSNAGYIPWVGRVEILNSAKTTVLASGNSLSFTAAVSKETWFLSQANNISLPAGTYFFRSFVGDFGQIDNISICASLDSDGDGLANYLDLDSDNDGCSDAFEAGTTTSRVTNFTQTGPYGANGFANALETTPESGVYNGTYTYGKATSSAIKSCSTVANADAGSASAGTGGVAVTNVAANDVMNGVTATPGAGGNSVLSLVSTSPGITLNTTTGSVSVAQGTAPGTYTLVYQLCDVLTPTTCVTAAATITVTPSIVASPDAGTALASGGTAVANVRTNDFANGLPATSANSSLSLVSSTSPGVTLNTITGSVSVTTGTAPGNYTLTYSLCLTGGGCTTSFASVTVFPTAVASPDAGTALSSGGAAVVDVRTNDVVNGVPATSANSSLSLVSSTSPGVTLNTITGSVSVTTGTAPGNYTLVYSLCSTGGSTTCTTSFASVTVLPSITASPDAGTALASGGTAVADVRTNDVVNGLPATSANSSLSLVSSTSPGVTLNTTTGSVSVATGTAPGNYTLTYSLCTTGVSGICTTGFASVTVLPSITATSDAGSANSGTGGTAVADVRTNDVVNGVPATSANSSLSLVSSTSAGVTLNTTTGSVLVAQGTAPGTYTLTYSLCTTGGSGICTTSFVIVTVSGPDLTVAISQPSPALVVGQTSNVLVTITNIGTAPTGGPASFTLSIPASVAAPATFTSNGFSCATSGTLVSCSSPVTITNGASTTAQIPITPLLAGAGTSPVLSGTVTTIGESNYANNTATTTVTTPVAAPDVTILIGQASPALVVGQTSTIPITVRNVGTAPTVGPVSFTLSIPASVSVAASFTNNGFSCTTSGTLVSCSSSAIITSGASTTVQVSITPLPAAVGTSPVVSGTVATANDSNPTNNTATTTVTPAVVAPDLTISIGQPSPTLVIGQTSTVPIIISNGGTSPTTGPVSFTLSLPANVSAPAAFTSNGFSCTTSGTLVACSSPTPLVNSGNVTVSVSITPNAVTVNPVLSATVATANESNVNNNTATTTVSSVLAPDLIVSLGQPAPVLVAGQTSSIPVTISNIGTASTTGAVSFTLSIPASVTAPATFASNGFSCSTSTTLVSCSSPTAITNGVSTSLAIPITPLNAAVGTSPVLSGTVATVLESNPNNNTATITVTTPVAGQPDVVVSIGQPSPILSVGQTSTIPVSISNVGTAPTSGPVSFTLSIPASVTAPASFASNGFSCAVSGTLVVCSSPTSVSNGASITVQVPVTPLPAASGTTPVVSATVATGNESNPNNNTTTTTVTTAVVAPDLTVSLGQPAPVLVAGQPSSVPVSINNIGTASTTGAVSFTLSIPSSVTAPASFVSNGFTCSTSGTLVSCSSSATITNGVSTSLAIPITPLNAAVGTSPVLSGTVATANESNVTNNTATITVTTPVAGQPDVVVSIGQPSPILSVGQTSTIPVSISNVGTAPTSGPVSFTLSIPASVTAPASFTSNGFSCAVSGTLVVCSSPATISNGASITVQVPVTPLPAASGTTPVVSATVATGNESNPNNNTTTTTVTTAVVAPDLTVSLGQPAPVLVAGQPSSVPVSINNIGTAPTSGPVSFTLSIPSSITAPASFVSNGFTCSTSGTLVSCSSSATITSGASTSLAIPITPLNAAVGTSPVLSGTVATANESNVTNNTATVTATPVAGQPDVVVSIGQPSPILSVGQTSTIPVSISNVGTAPTSGPVSFTLSIPASVTAPASFASNGFSCAVSGTLVVCSSPTSVSNGASITVQVPVTPLPAASGTTPVVSATVATGNESNPNNNTTTTTVTTAVVAPDLTVSLGQPAPVLVAGQTSSIPVTISNIGTAPTSGPVSFTLSIPSSVTAPASFVSNGFTCSTSGTLVSCSSSATITNGVSTSLAIPITPLNAAVGTSPVLSGTVATANESNVTNNTASVTATPVAGQPDVIISIGQPSPILSVGQTSTIPVSISNVGTAPTSGPVSFTLSIPASVSTSPTFTSNGFSCSTSGTLVVCSSPTSVSNGASTTVLVPVTPLTASAGANPVVSATVATGNESNPNNNTTTTTVTTAVVAPDLTVSLGQPAPVLVAGQPSSVPVSINNIGTAPTSGPVSFTLSIPSSVTAPASFVSNGFTCSTSGTLVSCSSSATITNGVSTSLAIPITPLNAAVGTSPVLSGTVATANESNVTNNTATVTATPVAGQPDVVVSIGQPSPILSVGQTSTIPVSISNVGTAPTNGPVSFTLSIPASVSTSPTFTSNGFSCSTSGTLVVCSSPTSVSNGASTTVLVPVTPLPAASGTTPVVSATVATGNESNPNNNTTTTTVTTAVVAPDLTVSLGQPAPVLVAGQPSSVPVSINNIGTASTSGLVSFTLSIPASVTAPATFFSDNGFFCITSGTLVSCSSSVTITNGASTSLTIPITPQNAAVGMSPVLSGTVATANESNVTNNTATVTATPVAGQPDVIISIGQPSPNLSVGQTSTIPVSVSNVGTAPTTGLVTFTLSIPATVSTPATFTSNGFSCATSGTLVVCSSPATISNGASAVVLVPVTPLMAAAGTNPVLSATVATGNESNPNNNTTTTTVTTPVVAPDLVTGIGAASPGLVSGQTSTIPLSVSNIGAIPAPGPITATLFIPADISAPATFTSAGGWSCNTTGTMVVCTNAGSIASGAFSVINIPVIPSPSAVGSQTFTATAATAVESNTANNGSIRVENPSAPTVTITSPSSVTTLLTTVISGTATPNSSVVLSGPGNANLCTATVSAAGTYSCTITVSAGPITVTAVANNIGGNSTPVTTSFTAVGPPTVSITSPQNVTTTITPTITGTATPGSTVVMRSSAGTLCTTTATATGSYSCLVSASPGVNSVSAVATNAAGVSNTAVTSFTVIGPPTVSIISPRNTPTTATPTISGTATPGSTVVLTGAGNTVLCTTTATAGGTYSCVVSLTATGPQTVTAVATNIAGVSTPATTSFNVSVFAIRVKVLLQGALIGVTGAGAGSIMRDDLRVKNLIPLTEPYSSAPFTSIFTHVGGGGGETTTSAVLSATSATDAIVDWVFVELRNAINPAQVLYTRSGLVQRDGDVVDVDGVSPLSFTATSDAYLVSVRHRNHLGAMASNLMLLNGTVRTVDFTDPSLATYGTNARQITGSKAALWGGNSDYFRFSGQTQQSVIYQGSGNDVTKVLLDLLNDSGNTGGPGGSTQPTFIGSRYLTSDLDLDGFEIYQGTTNDLRVIFSTVLGHPGNSTHNITYIVSEQLP